MTKKTIISILAILALTTTISIIIPSNLVVGMEPNKLKIYSGPKNVPADNRIYECIFVQLLDSNSRPARATRDTTVSLSSSLTSVGDVDPNVTISEGSTFAIAKFHSTFTPGTTTIAATASGYGTVQTNLVTAAPVPSKIAVYGFPCVVPTDGNQHESLVVQLQDLSGNPAKAPLEGVTITLTSSNSSVASVPASVTISGGQTYTLSNLTSNVPGSATITAMTSGYSSASTSITTQLPSVTQPKTIRIYTAPPKTLADNTVHSQIAIQLLNAAGQITQQPLTPITIELSSSSENVGKVQSTLEIPTGQVYATATFSTTYKAGITTITAAATDLITDTETITTIGPIPNKLALYCCPSTLPADAREYNTIQVQLQDSRGKPALDPNGDVTVSLFSSDPTIGIVPQTLTIPYGETYATTTFTSTYVASSAAITAQASGYATGQGQMRTYLIDQSSLTVAVTSDPSIVVSGKQTNITAYITDPGGNPTPDVTVKFTSSGGGTFSTVKALGDGYYTSMFTAPHFETETNLTVTATVSKTDFITSTGTIQLVVAPLVSFGTLQMCVKDDDAGQPISNVTLTMLSQPASMTNIAGTTNRTGYVTFRNAVEGNYTFNISKEGYLPINITLNFKVNSPAKTLFLTKSNDNQPPPDLTVVLIILVAVIVVIAVVIVVLKRKKPKQKTRPQSKIKRF
jgi:hypothetical protein